MFLNYSFADSLREPVREDVRAAQVGRDRASAAGPGLHQRQVLQLQVLQVHDQSVRH